MKLKHLHITLLSAFIIATPALAKAPVTANKSPVVATVNGCPIYKSELDYVTNYLTKNGFIENSTTSRQQVLDDLINKRVFVNAAKKAGINKEPNVRQQIKESHDNILINYLLREYLKKHTPSKSAIKAKYQQTVKSLGDKEYNVQHILVQNKKTADDLIAKLKSGEKFDKLARKYSIDSGSKNKGGHLGWSRPSNFIAPFAKALTKLKTGQFTEQPVQSEFGWHIILLDGTRPVAKPTFQELEPQIKQQLTQQAILDYQKSLRKKATVKITNK